MSNRHGKLCTRRNRTYLELLQVHTNLGESVLVHLPHHRRPRPSLPCGTDLIRHRRRYVLGDPLTQLRVHLQNNRGDQGKSETEITRRMCKKEKSKLFTLSLLHQHDASPQVISTGQLLVLYQPSQALSLRTVVA